jgi:hypothetical protein
MDVREGVRNYIEYSQASEIIDRYNTKQRYIYIYIDEFKYVVRRVGQASERDRRIFSLFSHTPAGSVQVAKMCVLAFEG